MISGHGLEVGSGGIGPTQELADSALGCPLTMRVMTGRRDNREASNVIKGAGII